MAGSAHLGLLSPGLLVRAAAALPWAQACLGLVNHGLWRPLITQVGGLAPGLVYCVLLPVLAMVWWKLQ
jgi:hypothetical protein